MKLYRIFIKSIIIGVSLFLLSCTVNQNTGLIRISNHSGSDVTNFKLGETTIFFILKSGAVYDYWFTSTQKGTFYAKEVDSFKGKKFAEDSYSKKSYIILIDDPVCIFKTNYQYTIDIVDDDNDIIAYINPGYSPGETTQLHYPAE